MKNVSSVIFEDKLYVITKRINNFLYFFNPANPKDFFIKKAVKKDNGEVLIKIKDQEEFKTALKFYQNDCEL